MKKRYSFAMEHNREKWRKESTEGTKELVYKFLVNTNTMVDDVQEKMSYIL